ncbi:MAG: FAD-binding oxidoreductase [Alteromonas oceani]
MSKHILTIGADTKIEVEERDTVLRAALRAGLGFPYECNSGGCGGCHFQLLEGEINERWAQAPGISEKARASGRHLACQSEMSSDCTIKVRLKPAFQPRYAPARVKVSFAGKHDIGSDMAEYLFQSDGPAEFIPGQYAMLKAPGIGAERAYSMANLPNQEGIWSFVIKQVPNGLVSNYLANELQEGDVIELDGPFGVAHYRNDSPRDIVCIAGGSGLSPILSILRSAVSDPLASQRKIYFFFGARTIEGLCQNYLRSTGLPLDDRIQFVPVLSEAPLDAQWPGSISYVHEAVSRWLGEVESAQSFEYYLCGPPLMTDAVENLLLLNHSLPAEQLHFDRFV